MPARLLCPQNFPGKNTRVDYHSLLQGIFSTQGLNTGLPQADSLPAEPQGKPKNTGVRSLSLLQQIFPTQELNRGLLHCRLILYQLSYQGISCYIEYTVNYEPCFSLPDHYPCSCFSGAKGLTNLSPTLLHIYFPHLLRQYWPQVLCISIFFYIALSISM